MEKYVFIGMYDDTILILSVNLYSYLQNKTGHF